MLFKELVVLPTPLDKTTMTVRMPFDAKLVAIRPFSSNPADKYLAIVMCEREAAPGLHDPFVVWMYNYEDHGCHHGNYFSKAEDAFQFFCKRGVI